MRKEKHYLYAALLCGAVSLAACSSDDDAPGTSTTPPDTAAAGGIAISVPSGGFSVARCRVLTVRPETDSSAGWALTWSVGDSILSTADSLDFISLRAGEHLLTLKAVNTDGRDTTISFAVRVSAEEKEYSPYITSVPEYMPAPGQFVNELPEYSDGDSQTDMNRKALEAIGNNTQGMITLGSYGGYVVCGFDHTIVNVPGQYDFKVLGNAFYSNTNPNPDAPAEGGSCEPGIVMVAYDRNRNGQADDDEWYELAGSEYGKETTVKGYEITYFRPEEGHMPVPGDPEKEPWMTDAEYIMWTDNQDNAGYVYKNMYHRQDYYPKWIESETMTFSGTLLPGNARDESGTGNYWVLYAYPWGYADNRQNSEDTSSFDISWAVDAQGNKVHLPGIDFVKIYTGVNQYCGWLGETSTEVMGINDLHLIK